MAEVAACNCCGDGFDEVVGECTQQAAVLHSGFAFCGILWFFIIVDVLSLEGEISTSHSASGNKKKKRTVRVAETAASFPDTHYSTKSKATGR